MVNRIVEVNKPAHTEHRLEAVYAASRLGIQSRVGLDLVLGAEEEPRTRLGGNDGTATNTGVLGVDSVLGPRRPDYVRPLVMEL